MPNFSILDHIWQLQQTFVNFRRKISTLLEIWEMKVMLVQNFKGIAQETTRVEPLIF